MRKLTSLTQNFRNVIIAFYQDKTAKKQEEIDAEALKGEGEDGRKPSYVFEKKDSLHDDLMPLKDETVEMSLKPDDRNEEEIAQYIVRRVTHDGQTESLTVPEKPSISDVELSTGDSPGTSSLCVINDNHFYKGEGPQSIKRRKLIKKKSVLQSYMSSQYFSIVYRMKKIYFYHRET